jgi:uncharacterized protein (DUF885 family)
LDCGGESRRFSPSKAAAPAAAQNAAWDAFRDAFIEDYFELNPSDAVSQGRHEFDGSIGDWSAAALSLQIEFLHATAAQVQAFDEAQLSPAQRFERSYLAAVVRRQLFWLEDADEPHKNLTWYVDNGLDPNVYIARRETLLARRAVTDPDIGGDSQSPR